MKVALTADWHIRGKDLPIIRAQLLAMAEVCRGMKVDLVLVAGDVFETSGIQDRRASTGAQVAVVNEVLDALGDIPVLMIPGNHDLAGAGSKDALHVCHRETVSVVRETKMINTIPSLSILCVPWKYMASVEEEIEKVRDQGPWDILLGHFEVVGSLMNSGKACEGAANKFQVSRAYLLALGVRYFALGHFHKRQELWSGCGGYIGAIRQMNFGEEGNPAGFEVLDSVTGDTEWVELEETPRHWTVVLKPGEDPPALPGPKEKLRVRFDGLPPGEQVLELERQGVDVQQIVDRQERVRRADVPKGVLTDPHALVGLWAETQNPPVKEYRLTRMQQLLGDVLGEPPF